MKTIITLTAALSLSACALPTTSVNAGSARPTLTVVGAPTGASLFVDGLPVGLAAQYNGAPNVLLVEEGTHGVELRIGNNVLIKKTIYASSGENAKFIYNPESAK